MTHEERMHKLLGIYQAVYLAEAQEIVAELGDTWTMESTDEQAQAIVDMMYPGQTLTEVRRSFYTPLQQHVQDEQLQCRS